MRAERGADRCITLDAGDTIQGTPLAYYYAKIEPITAGAKHPMATAMNAIGYDAAALGNHEYNYGLDTLRAFEDQCDHPLLSANSVDWDTGEPIFTALRAQARQAARRQAGHRRHPRPGHPGRGDLGRHQRRGQGALPRHRRAGEGHGAPDEGRRRRRRRRLVPLRRRPPRRRYGDALPYPENASRLLAEQVPDIDAILVGHAHVEVPERKVTNTVTGREVLLSEPLYWGMRVSVMDLDLVQVRGQWTRRVARASTLLNANTVPEDAEIAALVRPAHEKVLTYVNSVIGTCTQAMSASTSRYQDTAAMDFINLVQAETVKAALVGHPAGGPPGALDRGAVQQGCRDPGR